MVSCAPRLVTKMSLYSVSICAMRPSARLSIAARTASLITLSARLAAAVSGRVASATRPMATKPMAPDLRRSSRAIATAGMPLSTPDAPSVSVMAREPISGMRKKVVPSVPTIEPAVDIP